MSVNGRSGVVRHATEQLDRCPKEGSNDAGLFAPLDSGGGFESRLRPPYRRNP